MKATILKIGLVLTRVCLGKSEVDGYSDDCHCDLIEVLCFLLPNKILWKDVNGCAGKWL